MADCDESSVGSSGIGKPRTSFLAQPKLLKASILNNPFCLASGDDSKRDLFNPFAAVSSNSDKINSGNSTDASAADNKNSKEVAFPKFVPLQSSGDSISFAGGNTIAATPSGLSRAGGFVFGQNLKERVANSVDDENGPGPSSSAFTDHPPTNGSSNSLFSVAAQSATDAFSLSKSTGDGNALAQSAQTWERIRDTALPPIPPEQPVMTGEEGEINQLQMNCRLFAFEGGLWKERGRGQLRLNDAISSSRLVCRSAGSLRILLNTKIWAEMTVDRPGTKSLRITATDSQEQLKVFLIMAHPDEISQLYKALSRRVSQAQRNDEISETSKSSSEDALSKSENDNDNSTESIQKDILDNSHPHNIADIKEMEKSEEAEEDESPIVESANNPVVIISNEEDDNAINREVLKRSRSEDSDIITKKMCMPFPSNDDGTPL